MWAAGAAEVGGVRGGSLLLNDLGGMGGADWLREALADPDRLVLLCEAGGRTAGFLLASCTSEAGAVARIDAVYVEPAIRRTGVGKTMMTAAARWAENRGAVGLDAPALPGSRPAKAFFEAHGYVARLLVMHRQIAPHRITASATRSPGAVPVGEQAGRAAKPAPTTASPELCVGAVALNEGRILLVKRGKEPARWTWSVPGGRVKPGETMAEAVEREMHEETGLVCSCGELIGWAERLVGGRHLVIADFKVEVVSTLDPVAGDDAVDAAWIGLDEVGRLALAPGLGEFLSQHGILRGP
jgi:8-oxo-dGTP diphosphatase